MLAGAGGLATDWRSAMSLSDKLLLGSVGVVSDVADWVHGHVFEGHEWRLVVLMLLMFAVVGGME